MSFYFFGDSMKNFMKYSGVFLFIVLSALAYIVSEMTAILYADSIAIFVLFPMLIILSFFLYIPKICKISLLLLSFITLAVPFIESSRFFDLVFPLILMVYLLFLLYIHIKARNKDPEKRNSWR